MWIERSIEGLVRDRVAQRPVVVVTGARQAGKTALVRRLFPELELVSLDLPSEAEQAERDPGAFLTRHPPPLIIDEVQYAPALFRHLKVRVDADRERTGMFILTGSQKLPLMRAVAESLAGRADVIELENLTWAEVQAAGAAVSVEAFLLRSGFPELWGRPSLDADGFHRSYLATYLERDLRTLLKVGSLRDFERFVRACALRSAQLLNRADLARDVGISGSTAAAWLSVLEASGQVTLLEPWFANRGKSLVKSPKLYLNDAGFCAFLCGVRSVSDLLGSPLAGALWETLVFSEIRRRQSNRRGGWGLHFWHDRTREADFLLHHGGRFRVADAKWAEHPGTREAAGLERVVAMLGPALVDDCLLLCRAVNPYPVSSRTQALPLGSLPAAWQ